MPLHNGYGLTEAAPTVSQTRLDAPRADTSVGTAIPGVELRMVGTDGVDVAPGEAGELWVRGPNVMQGYYREPAATAAALRPGGWLNTGDMARQDAGRRPVHRRPHEGADHPLRLQRVPAGSRDGAERPPGGDAVGRGRAGAGRRQRGSGGLRPARRRAQAPVDADALRAWAAERLAPYKRPSRIVLLDALPAAATGKVLKHVLKEMAAGL